MESKHPQLKRQAENPDTVGVILFIAQPMVCLIGYLHVGRLCVCMQGKPEFGVESREVALLGTGDLLEMRGTCTVLKPPRKDAFLDWVLVLSKT